MSLHQGNYRPLVDYMKSRIPLKKCLCLCDKMNIMDHDTHNVVCWFELGIGQTQKNVYMFLTGLGLAYSPCCASHLTCYCTGLLTVWSLWGNPGMARCRKKSALAFGYIQKPKALWRAVVG